MRFLAIILSLYISTFTLCPAVIQLTTVLSSADACCMANACEEDADNDCSDENNDQQQPANCCCNGVVNFCMMYIVSETPFQFASIETDIQKARLLNDNITSSYMSDCWHPPKFV